MWLSDNLLTDDSHYAHHYKLRDEHGCLLTQHGGIWILELNKFNAKHIESEEQRWLQFFKTGEQLNDDALPDWMTTEEMKQAMNTLSRFSEKKNVSILNIKLGKTICANNGRFKRSMSRLHSN
ncbi:PD-(D/E)XK nuclease family transposase [Methylocucumis oryzae]|uniref:PD-(D/E)XK nuclease family transposase n=1 Tax=Methylocucumis oryzae TaxID=1632867 RepID=UPI0019553EE6